jgi:hypothetical protein
MRCHVCSATWPDGAATQCPQCGFDAAGPQASDPAAILRARESFKDKSTAFAPGSRVTAMDRLKPWLGLALGFVIFVLWWRTCSSGGRLW